MRGNLPHPWTYGKSDLNHFVERGLAGRRAKSAAIVGLIYGLERRARAEDAAATGTENVPLQVEDTELGGMQKSGNGLLLIQLMLGGKGERINAAKRTVRCVLDESFDNADWVGFGQFA